MNYKDVISRAWRYTWQNKSMWVLGFFAGGFVYLILPFYMVFLQNGFLDDYNSRLLEYNYPTSRHALDALPTLAPIAILALLGFFVVLLLALSVVQIVADVGLVYAGAIADSDMKPRASHSWRKGLANFWRALGVGIVSSLPMIILLVAFVAIIVIALIPLFGSLASGDTDAAPFLGTLFGSLGVMLVALFVYEVLSVVVGLFTVAWSSLSLSAAILEHRSVGASLSRGWQFIKQRFGTVLLATTLGYVVAWIFGVALDVFILPLAFSSALGSTVWLPIVIASIGAIFGCAAGTLMTIFIRNLWTVSFRRLQAMELAEVLDVTTIPPASPSA